VQRKRSEQWGTFATASGSVRQCEVAYYTAGSAYLSASDLAAALLAAKRNSVLSIAVSGNRQWKQSLVRHELCVNISCHTKYFTMFSLLSSGKLHGVYVHGALVVRLFHESIEHNRLSISADVVISGKSGT